MGKMQVTLIGVRVAGTPTFIPGKDANGHHTMLTVINNRGKNRAGVAQSDEVTLNFWRKYAQTAALYLDVGREINVIGELRSFTKDTGIVKPGGGTELHRRNEVLVDSFFFGADSLKELSGRVNANLQTLKNAGKLDPNATITAEDLLAVSRGASYDYNPAHAAQTGMYGCAKVYISKQGFVQPGVTAVPAVADASIANTAAIAANAASADAKLAELTKQIEEMKASVASNTKVEESVATEVTDVTEGAEEAKVVSNSSEEKEAVDPFKD